MDRIAVLQGTAIRARGRAGTESPELYFAESPSDVELAKALCRSCPMRASASPVRFRAASVGRVGR